MCFCPGFSEPHGRVIEKDCLPPVSPLVEAEMIRIDSVLSNFGDSSGEAPSLVPHQTPQRVKTCKKRTFISIKPHSIKAERRVLYHISEHLGGSARSHSHCIVTFLCVGFIALCFSCSLVHTHNSCFPCSRITSSSTFLQVGLV